ncbi:MAG: hypothetical protein ABDH49_08590 [Candidatus Hydrothermales bacterium]
MKKGFEKMEKGFERMDKGSERMHEDLKLIALLVLAETKEEKRSL